MNEALKDSIDSSVWTVIVWSTAEIYAADERHMLADYSNTTRVYKAQTRKAFTCIGDTNH
jgi:hypothetical protein